MAPLPSGSRARELGIGCVARTSKRVIARSGSDEAIQNRAQTKKKAGLLRSARNDGVKDIYGDGAWQLAAF
jgi:hypothetical protein